MRAVVQFRSIARLRHQSKTSTENEEKKYHVHKGFHLNLISKELNQYNRRSVAPIYLDY